MPETALARLKDSPAADRAKEELERYLVAQAQRLLAGAARTMGRSTAHLNAIADGSSPGFRALALESARRIGTGRGPLRAVVESGAKQAKDTAAHALRDRLGRCGGKPGRGRPTAILESVDVGVPVDEAYHQWTRYRDETTGNRNAKVFWSRRSWTVHLTDQIPDERIVWTSEGDKGTARGVVTFHELTVDLTRVLLVIEYHPQGLVEKTAALWHAQGRRVRRDLEDYARCLTLKDGPSDGRGGEIRDGEFVDSSEDLYEDDGAEEPDEIDAGDTTDLYGDEAERGDADEREYEGDYEAEGEDVDEEVDEGYAYEADGLDHEQAEPDEEPEPEREREAARPRGRHGSRRSA
ncbi:SRPBCC family protein [Streptomyces sp. NPDC059874]|uniref:SRPBCC family protein n=1 Tax=Streptomyces sp. NPDC059874 TaxID=3346983 RepID=UPI0036475D85